MDIWAWVFELQRELREAGHERIAGLIETIPGTMDDPRPDLLLAALPEALAAARSLKNPWLEVYFRHWAMQNRLTRQAEGEVALGEAVSLLEFAHRDETLSCPQAVCVTQDVAICYSNVDGPGWADERMAVSAETLARINADWPCFSCISCEYADALLDAKRAPEAEVFLEKQAQAMREVGRDIGDSFRLNQATALWSSGKSYAALAILDDIEAKEDDDADEGDVRRRIILRASIFAEHKDFETAATILPDWDDLKPGSYETWSYPMFLIAKAVPERNTWQLGRSLHRALQHASRVGAHHKAVTIALRHAELALARGASWTARQALALAQVHADKLRFPEEMQAAVAAMRSRALQMQGGEALPVPAAELVTFLRAQESASPENDVEWLLAACEQRPADSDLAELAASALGACGADEAAREHLWRFVRANPTIDGPNFQLLRLLLEAGDLDGVASLASESASANPLAALWCRAQIAYRRESWQEVGELLAEYLAAEPAARGARRMWADAAMANRDLSTALRLRQELAAMAEAPGDDDWDLLTVASAAQAWATVRLTAKRLDLELEGEEGPVEEDWGAAFIQFDEEGEAKRHYARRTGPTTARIVGLSRAPATQHGGDWVAFDAAPVERAPEDEEERAHFIYTYRAVYTIAPGGLGETCFVDGAYAGDALYEAFATELAGRGWVCIVTSDDDYTVTDPETGDAIPGRYFQVAAPGSLAPTEVDKTLHELTRSWPHPVCWPRYAERAGLEVGWHMDIVERYGL